MGRFRNALQLQDQSWGNPGVCTNERNRSQERSNWGWPTPLPSWTKGGRNQAAFDWLCRPPVPSESDSTNQHFDVSVFVIRVLHVYECTRVMTYSNEVGSVESNCESHIAASRVTTNRQVIKRRAASVQICLHILSKLQKYNKAICGEVKVRQNFWTQSMLSRWSSGRKEMPSSPARGQGANTTYLQKIQLIKMQSITRSHLKELRAKRVNSTIASVNFSYFRHEYY